MPMPFEFVIDGPPVSQQARNRSRVAEWTRTVQDVAESTWENEPPYSGEVAVTITYLFEGTSLDIDNVPKPILDALKGVVYSDDSQVSDLMCRKRRLTGDLRIPAPSQLLIETRERLRQFLHVTVNQALTEEVTK